MGWTGNNIRTAIIGRPGMMRILAIGRSRDGPEAALFARYSARIRPALALTEFPDGNGAPAEFKRREGEALLAALPAQTFAIALDCEGKCWTAPHLRGSAGGLAEPVPPDPLPDWRRGGSGPAGPGPRRFHACHWAG